MSSASITILFQINEQRQVNVASVVPKTKALLVLIFAGAEVDFSCLSSCVDCCTARSYRLTEMKHKKQSFFMCQSIAAGSSDYLKKPSGFS